MTTPLPPPNSWQFPTQTTAALCTSSLALSSSYASHSSYHGVGDGWCMCDACHSMVEFLRDPKQNTKDFRAAKDIRSHLEQRLPQLRNPYLGWDTIHSGSPLTLRVTKKTHLHPTYFHVMTD